MNKSESKYFNTAIRMNKALVSLLEKKDLEYVTVSDICREAGVNRSTFYLHYENIGDLLAETTRYLLDDFLSCFTVEPAQVVDGFQNCALSDLNFITERYLMPYLCYMRDNRRVFAILGLLREYDAKSKGIDSGGLDGGELLKELLLKIFTSR